MKDKESREIEEFLRHIDPHITRFKKILADLECLKTAYGEEGFKNERARNLSSAYEAFLAKRKEVRRLQDEGVTSEDSPSFDECLVDLIKLRSEYERVGAFISDEEREFLGNFLCLGLYFGAGISECLDQLEFLAPSFIPDMEKMLKTVATLDPFVSLLSASMKEMSSLGKTLPRDELKKLYLENPDMRAKDEKEGEIALGKIMKNIEEISQKGIRSLTLKHPPIQTLTTFDIILRMAQLSILFGEGKKKS